VKHFELMEIHRVRKGKKDKWGVPESIDDFEADLPGYNDSDMVESNPETVGTAMDIVKYLLKHELHEYKIIKRKYHE